MSERPFRVLGVQQIAVGHLDKSRLRELWVDLLGLRVARSHRDPAENVDEHILIAGGGPTAIEIDLMEPIDPGRTPPMQRGA